MRTVFCHGMLHLKAYGNCALDFSGTCTPLHFCILCSVNNLAYIHIFKHFIVVKQPCICNISFSPSTLTSNLVLALCA